MCCFTGFFFFSSYFLFFLMFLNFSSRFFLCFVGIKNVRINARKTHFSCVFLAFLLTNLPKRKPNAWCNMGFRQSHSSHSLRKLQYFPPTILTILQIIHVETSSLFVYLNAKHLLTSYQAHKNKVGNCLEIEGNKLLTGVMKLQVHR